MHTHTHPHIHTHSPGVIKQQQQRRSELTISEVSHYHVHTTQVNSIRTQTDRHTDGRTATCQSVLYYTSNEHSQVSTTSWTNSQQKVPVDCRPPPTLPFKRTLTTN